MSADPTPFLPASGSTRARTTSAAIQLPWSKAALSIWGKSSGYDGEYRMPLAQHLLDLAGVATQ
jgi:hypothetical protein